MPHLVILMCDRNADVLDVMRHAFKNKRRASDTTSPEIVTTQKPQHLIEEALRRCLLGEDLVVTTCLLYGGSHMKSLDILRACAQRHIPSVLVSGADTPNRHLHEARQLATVYVQKPFSPSQLVQAVFKAAETKGQPMATA